MDKLFGGPRSGFGNVMAEGGGNPRCGVPILRGLLTGSGGRAEGLKAGEKVEEGGCCIGEYAWGLTYPF